MLGSERQRSERAGRESETVALQRDAARDKHDAGREPQAPDSPEATIRDVRDQARFMSSRSSRPRDSLPPFCGPLPIS